MAIHDLRWVCATAVALCVVNAAMATPEPGPFEALTLKISVEHKDLLPMEPFQITISFANETDRPVSGHTGIEPGVGFLKIYFSTGDGPFEDVGSGGWPVAESLVKKTQFAPGWKHTLTAILYGYVQTAGPDRGEPRYLFEAPGTGRIKATFQDLDGKKGIESNVLTIEARQPVGEDARAYAFLKNLHEREDKDARGRPISYHGFLMGSGLPEIEAKQEEFLSKFPNSRYARYLYWSLGYKYSWGKGNGGIQRGLEYLEKAGGYEDFFLAPEALGLLVEACVKQGNLEKARQHLATLQEKFPESISAHVAAHHVQQASSDVKGAAE